MYAFRPALLVIALSLAGCALVEESGTVLREDVAGHRVLVQLEAVPEGPTTPFAHPVRASEQELAANIDGYLAEIRYGRPKADKTFPLLEVEDRQRLATGLARGLIRAGQSERVLFVISIDDGGDVPWFTPDRRLTRGVAFVDAQSHFNLAFDLVDDRIDLHDPDPYDPTQRSQTRARLTSESGEDRGPGEKGARRLWVAWRLPSDSSTPATPPKGCS